MSASLAYAEALAAAIRVEENGALFYKKAAAGAIDPDSAAVYARLAAMEEEHRSYFKALALALEQRDGIFLSDPAGGFGARVKAMADAGVFGLSRDAAAYPDSGSSAKSAAEFALGVEKDSVIFYLCLQEAVIDREEADKLGGIIKEELRHIAMLSGLLARLKN